MQAPQNAYHLETTAALTILSPASNFKNSKKGGGEIKKEKRKKEMKFVWYLLYHLLLLMSQSHKQRFTVLVPISCHSRNHNSGGRGENNIFQNLDISFSEFHLPEFSNWHSIRTWSLISIKQFPALANSDLCSRNNSQHFCDSQVTAMWHTAYHLD